MGKKIFDKVNFVETSGKDHWKSLRNIYGLFGSQRAFIAFNRIILEVCSRIISTINTMYLYLMINKENLPKSMQQNTYF